MGSKRVFRDIVYDASGTCRIKGTYFIRYVLAELNYNVIRTRDTYTG